MEKVLHSKKSMKNAQWWKSDYMFRKQYSTWLSKVGFILSTKVFCGSTLFESICVHSQIVVKSFERKMSDAIKTVILKYISCYQLALSAARKE